MGDISSGVFFVQFFNGLIIAFGIYMIASGLSLVFGVLGILNFAHGTLYMYGAFFVFTIAHSMFPNLSSSFWLALIVAPILIALFSILAEIGFLRPIYKADPLYQLLLTYGLVLIFGDLVKIFLGRGEPFGCTSIWFQRHGLHFWTSLSQLSGLDSHPDQYWHDDWPVSVS